MLLNNRPNLVRRINVMSMPPRNTAELLIALLGSFCNRGRVSLSSSRDVVYRKELIKDLIIKVNEVKRENYRRAHFASHFVKVNVGIFHEIVGAVARKCYALQKSLPVYEAGETFELMQIISGDGLLKKTTREAEDLREHSKTNYLTFTLKDNGSIVINPSESVFQISGRAVHHRQKRTMYANVCSRKKAPSPVPVQVRVGSRIKMGAVTIELTELHILEDAASDSENEEPVEHSNSSTMTLPDQVEADEPCYICLAHTGHRSPCLCSAAVHSVCLQQWCHQSDSSCCPICKNHINASMLFKGKSFMTFVVRRRTKSVPWVGQKEFSFELSTSKPLSLGRGKGAGVNNIILPDPSLSWRHAIFTLTEAKDLTVQDLNSFGGTYISVQKDQELKCFGAPVSLLLSKNVCVDLEINEPGIIRRMRQKVFRQLRLKNPTVATTT